MSNNHKIEFFDIINDEINKAKSSHNANLSCRPILSIAIPTFNRKLRLERQITKLVQQIELCGINADVEIIVSDNSSTDGTYDVIKQINFDYFNRIKITYFSNKYNLGSDANFALAILRASGSYVWLLSDDDELFDYALGHLYEKLISLNEKSTNACLFVNYYITMLENSPTAVVEIGKETNLSLHEFMIETDLKFGLISACVFRRDSLSEVDFKSYIGTNYIHMFIILQCLVDNRGSIVRRPLFRFDHPGVLVTRRSGKSRDTTRGDFYLNAHLGFLYFVSILLRKKIDWKSKFKLIRKAGDQNVNQIIFYKLTHENYNFYYIMKVAFTMLKRLWYNPFFYFFHIPLLFSPNFIAKFIEPFRWKYLQFRGSCMKTLRRLLGNSFITKKL